MRGGRSGLLRGGFVFESDWASFVAFTGYHVEVLI